MSPDIGAPIPLRGRLHLRDFAACWIFPFIVITRLVRVIHLSARGGMDCPDKPGNDGGTEFERT